MTTGPVGVGIIGAGMISDFYLENPDPVSRSSGAPWRAYSIAARSSTRSRQLPSLLSSKWVRFRSQLSKRPAPSS